MESVRIDHVIENSQRKLSIADDIRIIDEKENCEKSSVTPKVLIEISGGVCSTISSYKPLFRCYRYLRGFRQAVVKIENQNVTIVNKMFFKILTYKTLYFIYK